MNMQLGNAVFIQAAADDDFSDNVIGMEIYHLSALPKTSYERISYSDDEDICTMTQQDYCTNEYALTLTCNGKTNIV